MGKAFKRSMEKSKNNQFETLTRQEAINKVVIGLKKNTSVEDLVTLFGLTSEELLEGGADFEQVKSIEGILND